MRFKDLQKLGESVDVIVERTGRRDYPYECYHKDDHGNVGECKTLAELQVEIIAFQVAHFL